MEDTTLKDQELENVSGGEFRTVNTGDSRDAAIRAYPALNAPVIAVLPNGTAANSTGKFTYADGLSSVMRTDAAGLAESPGTINRNVRFPVL